MRELEIVSIINEAHLLLAKSDMDMKKYNNISVKLLEAKIALQELALENMK